MTGFGRSVLERDGLRCSVEARSVNHRYLDLAIRIRDGASTAEEAVRRAVTERLSRGRVDLRVEVEPVAGDEVRVEVRLPVISSVVAQLASLEDESGTLPPIEELTWSELLRIPEAVAVSRAGDVAAVPREDLERLERDAAAAALDDLVAARAREGAALLEVLLGLTAELRTLIEELAARRDDDRQRLLERSRARLAELVSGLPGPTAAPFDESRLAQEAVVLVERVDIAEEIERLRGHVDHFEEIARSTGPVGRRLEFLTQEISRELQTTAAKTRALESQRLVLDAKVLADRLREQVQNVE